MRWLIPTSALVAAACGGATHYGAQGTAHAPELRADVAVEPEGMGRDLDIEIHDMPAPESVDAESSRYGVWMIDPATPSPVFLGFVRYDSDIGYGDLETRIPREPVEILITAEPSEPGSEPGDVVLMRRRVP